MGMLDWFGEAIGELFIDALKIALIALILLVVGIVLLLGKFVLPKPWGAIIGLACIGIAIYLIWGLM